MGNGVSSNQGNLPSYGKRDVRRAADRKQHDWLELAEHPSINNQLRSLLTAANPYIGAQRGAEFFKRKAEVVGNERRHVQEPEIVGNGRR